MSSNLLDPRLSDCRCLFLRNYALDVNIGAYAFERQGSQRLVINVDVFIALAVTTPHHDALAEVVDYEFIRQSVREVAQRGHINLQETLCDELAQHFLAHPLVRAVRVSTEKPDVYPDCEAVGVEVFQFKRGPARDAA